MYCAQLLLARNFIDCLKDIYVTRIIPIRVTIIGICMLFAFSFYQHCAHCAHCASADEIDPLSDLPAMLGADDIQYFSSTYDLEGLYWALSNVFYRSERNPDAKQIKNMLPEVIVSKGGGSTYTSAYKIKHDLEQAYYLVEHSIDLEDDVREYYKNVIIPTLEQIQSNIPALEDLQKTMGLYAFQKTDYSILGIQNIYNKAFHVPEYSFSENSILSEKFQQPKTKEIIKKQWFNSDRPGVVVIDDILSPSALSTVQKLLMESTVWYQTKMPQKFGGYVGAYIDDGLHQRILLALAYDLHKALPEIMTGHDLKYLWAYKYDSEYSGINTHADQAAINVNIWVTPDDANLDPDSGGLIVFTAKPPVDWGFDAYNMETERVEKQLLEPTNYANVTIPYRSNRAVIFDSALFHRTDNFRFKQGYQNRRINLTILYGDMQKACSSSTTCGDADADADADASS